MREILCITLASALLGAVTCDGMAQSISVIEREMIDLVEGVSESIVSVAAVSGRSQRTARGPLGASQPMARNIGCGVVFDEDGLILTTASVVGYANQVEVTGLDGTRYTGIVIGSDRASDLAIVRAEDADIRPATFSDETVLHPGSLIFVLGNAFGSLPSVSMGVVSNVAVRSSDGDGEETLRLSVPINPGDIGGPVVNMKGEVVGIVIGRLSFHSPSYRMRWQEGAAFGVVGTLQPSNMAVALPAARAMRVAHEILETGGTQRGFLGVRVMNLSEEMKAALGGADITGVIVTEVIPGSPAESIGIRSGDVITGFASKGVESVSSLRDAVASTRPGQVVNIMYMRDSKAIADGVRIGQFIPEYIRRATLNEYTLRPEEVKARIEDLKAEIDNLKAQLKELEEYR